MGSLLLVTCLVAQARTYTNVPGQPTRIEIIVPDKTARHVPVTELAWLKAHQHVYIPPEWLIGPTVSVVDSRPTPPAPTRENRAWRPLPGISFYSPYVGPTFYQRVPTGPYRPRRR